MLSNQVLKLLNFPTGRQAFEYDCGAKALEGILMYYGFDIREELLMKYAETNTKIGTSISGMCHTLERFGLRYESCRMSLPDLHLHIDRHVPVLLLLQAWNGKNSEYKNDFSDNHWVILIGYDNNNIYCEDPYVFNRVFLTNKELKLRWHAKMNGKIIMNQGIAVFGKNSEYDPKKIVHMG